MCCCRFQVLEFPHSFKGLIIYPYIIIGSRGSSGNIVSDYGMDDRVIEVRSPTGQRIFPSSLCIQTGSGPTQPPIQWVPGVLSQGVKRGRGVTLTTHPHLVAEVIIIIIYLLQLGLHPVAVVLTLQQKTYINNNKKHTIKTSTFRRTPYTHN
jgi:hypothetical protein